MTDKTVKVVGPRKFHFKGSKNHFPTVNLAGGREHKPGEKIDLDQKKVAWATAYVDARAKLAALSVDGGGDDAALVRQQDVVDRIAKNGLRQSLSERGVPPEQLEAVVEEQWSQHADELRQQAREEYSVEQRRLAARAVGQSVDPTAVNQALSKRTQNLTEQFNTLSPEQRGDATAPQQHQLDPGSANLASERAWSAKEKYLNSIKTPKNEVGMGTAGWVDPVAQAVGPKAGIAIPMLAAMGVEGLSPAPETVDQSGKLTNAGGASSDAFLHAQGKTDDRAADLVHDYYAAVQNGDDAKAQSIAAELQQAHGVDPRESASNLLGHDTAKGLASRTGSQASNLVSAPFYSALPSAGGRLSKVPGLRSTPIAAMADLATPLIAGTVGAITAKPGERLSSAWDAAKGTVPNAIQSAGTGLALNKVLSSVPGATTPMGGFKARLTGGLKNLAKPSTLLRGGAVVGGIQGLRDLGGWATDDAVGERMNGELANQVEANLGRTKTQKTLDAAGAGASAMLMGNLDPARRQLGASWGRFDWAKNTPMGRIHGETVKQDSAVQASQAAKQKAMALMANDPRFAGAEPADLEALASMAADNAYNSGLLDYGRDANAHTADQWLDSYAKATSAYNDGKATPENLKYLEELADSPLENGQMTPAQQQSAARNAMLYHTFNRETSRRIIDSTRAPAPAPAPVPAPTPAPMPAYTPQPTAPEQAKAVTVPQAPAPVKPVVPPALPKVAAEFGQGPIGIAPVKPVEPVKAPEIAAAAVQPPTAPVAPPPTGVPPVAPAAAAPAAQAPAPAPAPRQTYQEAVKNLVDTNDLDAYHSWASGASQEERSVAAREMYRQGARAQAGGFVPDFLIEQQMRGMSQEQINKTIVDQVRTKAEQVGKQIGDSAKTNFTGASGGWGNYLKSNPSLFLIPIGLMIALGSKGKMGKILGALAAAGGAANLYGRYSALQDKGFHKAIQQKVALEQAGQWTPELEKGFQAQHGSTWNDLQVAQQSGVVNIPKQVTESAVKTMQESLTGAAQ